MHRAPRSARPPGRGDRGQIIVIAALVMMAMIGGVSLVIEGGNAYAHQRMAQNAIDSVANAGATVLAQRLGGAPKIDADVLDATNRMATANGLTEYDAYYTDVHGDFVNAAGTVVGSPSAAEQVGPADGDTTIPPGTQGVRARGSLPFDTTFARALGITRFTASADAVAVTGALSGGLIMPVVFPVSLADCDGSGQTVQVDAPWRLSEPALPHPAGQEWIVPLCKSGSGSFMILDLDPNKDCYEEVASPPRVAFYSFPVDVATDTGNDCAKKVEQATVDGHLQGQIVLIPICDDECSTQGGNGGTYHIIRITAFWLDFLSYSSNPTNSPCFLPTSPTFGTSMVNITGGNGSASCMAGWFVRYVTSGPVGAGIVSDGEAIGVQLIR